MEREYNLETLEHLENVSTNKCRSWIALWRSPFVARMQCSGFLTSARSFIEREVAPVPLSSLVHCSVPPPPLPCALQCTFFQGTVCAEFYFTTKCTTLQQFTTMQWTFFPTNFNAIHGTVLQCTMCTFKCTLKYCSAANVMYHLSALQLKMWEGELKKLKKEWAWTAIRGGGGDKELRFAAFLEMVVGCVAVFILSFSGSLELYKVVFLAKFCK